MRRWVTKWVKVFVVTLLLFFLVLPATTAAGNPAHEKLVKLSEAQRHEALTQLLQRSHEAYDRTVRSFFQGFSKPGHAFWNVACHNKRAFGIMIENDARGSTRILDCKILKVVAGVECFKKF